MYKTYYVIYDVQLNQWRFFFIFFDGRKETDLLTWWNFQSSPTQHRSRLSFVKGKGVVWLQSYNLLLKMTIQWLLSLSPLKWDEGWTRYNLPGSDLKGSFRNRSPNANPPHPRKLLTHLLKDAELFIRLDIFLMWVSRFFSLTNLRSAPEKQMCE